MIKSPDFGWSLIFIRRRNPAMTTIINIINGHIYDVYIGRAGFGKDGYFCNPFTHDKSAVKAMFLLPTREESIKEYTNYFLDRIQHDAEFKRRVMEMNYPSLKERVSSFTQLF
jgi:hypothetical protein